MAISEESRVAIVGGGLCGLSLAIALAKRNIPYKLYESRASFAEIGAGISLGPNTIQTLELIDPALGEAIQELATKNPNKDVWMQLRFAAATDNYKDGELITELMAPSVGSMTVHRNDLLQLLANQIDPANTSFNKKLAGVNEGDDSVTLKFADGTQETASILIACDGAHSSARKTLCGADQPSSSPQYSGMGAFRAVIEKEKLAASIGIEISSTSQIHPGPGGYLLLYPIERGESVNVGLWSWWEGPWDHHEWILPNQGAVMRKKFAHFGETAQKIMELMPDPAFYGTFFHADQPESLFRGRMCIIGDAAHSMPPHQGAGAGQAMEDAYVIAEVLNDIDIKASTKAQVETAFRGYESVRRPRVARVQETSVEAAHHWTEFWKSDVTGEDVEKFVNNTRERFDFIWKEDIAAQARRACEYGAN